VKKSQTPRALALEDTWLFASLTIYLLHTGQPMLRATGQQHRDDFSIFVCPHCGGSLLGFSDQYAVPMRKH
jgi:hypothetical protein